MVYLYSLLNNSLDAASKADLRNGRCLVPRAQRRDKHEGSGPNQHPKLIRVRCESGTTRAPFIGRQAGRFLNAHWDHEPDRGRGRHLFMES